MIMTNEYTPASPALLLSFLCLVHHVIRRMQHLLTQQDVRHCVASRPPPPPPHSRPALPPSLLCLVAHSGASGLWRCIISRPPLRTSVYGHTIPSMHDNEYTPSPPPRMLPLLFLCLVHHLSRLQHLLTHQDFRHCITS
ncbi:unnamed protein product [Laminaria digitata]